MVGYTIYHKKRKKKEDEWMQKLLKSKFFGSCFDHQEQRKNEVNLFCIDCHRCLCQHCISSSSHCLHKLLQIRRYVYNDVVRIHDMQKYIDCSKVQPYILNASKVVFLNPRPPIKPSKSTNGGTCCKVCERSLSDQNQYCSIACKVSDSSDHRSTDHQRSTDQRSSFQFFSFPIPEFNDVYVDGNQSDKSNFNDDDSINRYWLSKSRLMKPKKQLHKRKGIPHRAPFC